MLEDNQGAIYLIKNQQVGPRTKHIDVRLHFMRNMVASGDVKVLFVRSEENESDCLTKNVTEKLFQYHVPDLFNGTLKYWRKDNKLDGLSSDSDQWNDRKRPG
jgi:hypothetical protein